MNIPNFPNIPGLSNLPQIPENLKTTTVTWRHVLIMSHAVPVDRVRKLVPDQFVLDTMKINGQTSAIAQTICVFNDDFHYTPLPKPSLDFWQCTSRILTRAVNGITTTTPWSKTSSDDNQADVAKTGASGTSTSQNASTQNALGIIPSSPVTSRPDPGAFFINTFLGTRAAWVLQRAVASGAEHADFNIIQRYDEAYGDYHAYVVDIKAEGDTPPTQIAVRSIAERTPVAPFVNWEKMVQFLTDRPNGYYTLSLGGSDSIGQMPVEHEAMHPRAAQLMPIGAEVKEARLGMWEKLGVLTKNEMSRPFSMLIQPQLTVVSHPPRFVREEKTDS
jgi:hypothetical protein